MDIRRREPLGFGLGELGYNPEKFWPGVLEAAEGIIESGECIVDVTETDDGCMDARVAVMISFLQNEEFIHKLVEEHDKPHERSKLAGGGAIGAVVSEMSTGRLSGDNINDVLREVIPVLASLGIHVGAHTDKHSEYSTDKCGCGACDGLSNIMQNAVDDKKGLLADYTVHASINGGGIKIDPGLVKEVLVNWDKLLKSGFFDKSTGESRMQAIRDGMLIAEQESREPSSDNPKAVVKELGGNHTEAFRIKVHPKGKTFSQRTFRYKLREALRDQYPDIRDDELPGVFAVDTWRIEEIARATSSGEYFDLAYAGLVLFHEAAIMTLGNGTIKEYEAV